MTTISAAHFISERRTDTILPPVKAECPRIFLPWTSLALPETEHDSASVVVLGN